MISTPQTSYVSGYAELLEVSTDCKNKGLTVYSTCLKCSCKIDNEKSGLIIAENNKIITLLITCPDCNPEQSTKTKGGSNE